MLRAFSTAATGMTAQQKIVDVISNNLANINTNGFKRSQIDFQDLMYIKLQEAGTPVGPGVETPTGLEIGNGVKAASTTKIFSQGDMENTGRNLDIAIKGDGFLQVSHPSGKTVYTRDGSLRLDQSGNLTTSSGFRIEPGITIPADWKQISIGRDGTVSVVSGSDPKPQSVGQIQLARFANPSGLSSMGGNLLSETSASGAAVTGNAGETGLGTIEQRFLEKSNVQMVTELVRLIGAQRAYEINSRAIKAGDEMLNTANRMVN